MPKAVIGTIPAVFESWLIENVFVYCYDFSTVKTHQVNNVILPFPGLTLKSYFFLTFKGLYLSRLHVWKARNINPYNNNFLYTSRHMLKTYFVSFMTFELLKKIFKMFYWFPSFHCYVREFVTYCIYYTMTKFNIKKQINVCFRAKKVL